MSSRVQTQPPQQTLFGHPTGLFTLFFAEMWERFSYYGMRALLVFYMSKGFLGYTDGDAYGVYGAYCALVYATPFVGGMLADRLLGQRRSVVLGSLLMAAGQMALMVENETVFYLALAVLICGNGFFKANISTIVGSLYPKDSARKDAGFTIFYMGINLGAALSPLICGYVGETYGWHYGFGLAGVGMLVGVGVFVAPTRLAQLLILGGAVATVVSMLFWQESVLQLAVRLFMGTSLVAGGIIAFIALGRGGLPEGAGAAPSEARLGDQAFPELRKYASLYCLAVIASVAVLGAVAVLYRAEAWMLAVAAAVALLLPWVSARNAIYVGVAICVPVVALLVQRNDVAGCMLSAFGILALGALVLEVFRSNKVERERMYVVLVLMFFSTLFWAFYEQAGSSVNNFTDRNIDRVSEDRQVTAAEVGSTITFRVLPTARDAEIAGLPLLTQEQLGKECDGELLGRVERAKKRLDAEKKKGLEPEAKKGDAHNSGGEPSQAQPVSPATTPHPGPSATVFTLTHLTILRNAARREGASREDMTVTWTVSESNVGMGIGGSEIPASEFQAVNPIYILVFGLLFTALWGFLSARGWEPSTPVKFSLGLLQLGLSFGIFWYGAQVADGRGIVAMFWLLLGYLVQTTGELCLSPVGLSMVTRLSPTRIVSTVMGAWFLSNAFSNYLAGLIATFTGVEQQGEGEQLIPAPSGTVNLYGDVYGVIALFAMASALICFILAPLLSRWMHEEAYSASDRDGGDGPEV